jgi:uncharacterized protein DUF4214
MPDNGEERRDQPVAQDEDSSGIGEAWEAPIGRKSTTIFGVDRWKVMSFLGLVRALRPPAPPRGLLDALGLLAIGAIAVLAIAGSAAAATLYVSPLGSDTPTCGAQGAPCRNVDQAVIRSADGDTIRVAGGTYQYVNVGNPCTPSITTIVCVANKSLTIRGGFSASTWVFDPVVNPTVIDGQNTYRGVFVVSLGPSVRLTMAHITIQNGRALAPSTDLSAFGGGMLVDFSSVTLDSVTFLNNTATGSAMTGPGGDAAGSGLALRSSPGVSFLSGVRFQGNSSTGGLGTTRGGYAFGALFIYASTAYVENTQFINNAAQGGNSSGTGDEGGDRGDGMGAGVGIEGASSVILSRVTATGNTATGGAGTTYGGGGFGAGALVEDSVVGIQDSLFRANAATAAGSVNGGVAGGGGVMYFNSNGSIDRTQFILNSATGGASSAGHPAGSSGGGGLYLWHNNPAREQDPISVRNSVFTDNISANGATGSNPGGGGGGLFAQGLTVTIDHATFDRNRLGSTGTAPQVAGQAIVVVEASGVAATTVNLNYSVVSNHVAAAPGATAIVVTPGMVSGQSNIINFHVGSFSGNTHNTNSDSTPLAPGIINNEGSMTNIFPGYVSGGAPTYDYHLLSSSFLRGAATGSTMAVDMDYQPRNDGARDLGADEFVSGTCTPGSGDTDFDGLLDSIEAAEGTHPCAKDNDVFGSTRFYVMQQYRDFLGRESDFGGLYYWMRAIGGGTSPAAVTKSFFDSVEFGGTVAPIARLYFAYFNRVPDLAGFQYWLAQYRAGMSLNDISQVFASSAEFQGTYGSLTNSQFVTLVYQNVLGRPPDATGLAYWTNQLDSGLMTRGQVMVGFSESREYRQTSYNRVFVTMTYYGMLRRMPDPGGFTYWVGQLDGGASALDLINGFLGSIEYHRRFLP